MNKSMEGDIGTGTLIDYAEQHHSSLVLVTVFTWHCNYCLYCMVA